MCLQVILSFLYSMIIFRFFCDNLLTRFFLCLCSPSTHFVTFVVQRIGLTPLHLAQRELSHNSNKQDFSPSPALVTNLHTTYSYFFVFFHKCRLRHTWYSATCGFSSWLKRILHRALSFLCIPSISSQYISHSLPWTSLQYDTVAPTHIQFESFNGRSHHSHLCMMAVLV